MVSSHRIHRGAVSRCSSWLTDRLGYEFARSLVGNRKPYIYPCVPCYHIWLEYYFACSASPISTDLHSSPRHSGFLYSVFFILLPREKERVYPFLSSVKPARSFTLLSSSVFLSIFILFPFFCPRRRFLDPAYPSERGSLNFTSTLINLDISLRFPSREILKKKRETLEIGDVKLVVLFQVN